MNEAPAWWDRAIAGTVEWLQTSTLAEVTRNHYASDLGVPRERWSWSPLRQAQRGGVPGGPAPKYFAWCATQGIDPFKVTDVSKIVEWRDATRIAGMAHGTVVRRIAAVNGWYAAMAERGEAASLPTVPGGTPLAYEELGDETRALSLDQVNALRFAAQRNRSPLQQRNAVILDLLAVGGLLAAEVARLVVSDVVTSETGARQVLVRPPSGANRLVTLGEGQSRALDEYLAERRAVGAWDADPLFAGRSGQGITMESVAKIPQRLCTVLDEQAKDPAERAAAALLAPLAKTVSTRDLRRFAAVTARDLGVDLPDLRAWLGLRQSAAESVLGLRPRDVAASVLVAQALDAAAAAKTVGTDGNDQRMGAADEG